MPMLLEKPSSCSNVFDKQRIADLSASQISAMATEELVETIQVLPTASALGIRLEFAGRGTLERLAHLARRYCHRA